MRDHHLVKARTRQRTDSTHVLAAVRDLNRLGRVVETMRATLNVLATVAPKWVRATAIPPEWVERYKERTGGLNRLPSSDKDREAFGIQVGQDGYALLDILWSVESPEWFRALPAVETLRQVWVQNFVPTEGGIEWRQKDNIPPSALRINSPYDTEARYAYKRSTSWAGYKVHLSETCEEDSPHLITNVQTEKAVANDNGALPEIHEQLSRAELLPSKHLVDAGYIEAELLVNSQRAYGIELIGPAQGNVHWQREQGKGFDISHFKIDWEAEKAICPEGKASTTWRHGIDGRGNKVISATFAKADCSRCPSLLQCTK
ncbi:MAG: transposase, partial [Acidobacteria bacterium]|nr:transposase [Acidobacteriota bacterium]